mmetsp:Transcript_29858/g.77369  ORF Transcript_29858/g.77369 Transcript_29858/m.77369 type:complete len:117 (-) Transcript_29858:100-450(-)
MSIPRAGQVFGLKDGKSMCLMICDILLTWAKQKRLGQGCKNRARVHGQRKGVVGRAGVLWAGQKRHGQSKGAMGKAKGSCTGQGCNNRARVSQAKQSSHGQSKGVVGRARHDRCRT